MTKKIETKKLIAQLREQKAKNASISDVAKQTQTVQTKSVKDFIVQYTNEQIEKDSRKTVQQERDYLVKRIDANTVKVFNATMYTDENNTIQLFTQKLANQKVDAILANLAQNTVFSAKLFRDALKTCGGAFGDKIRNRLFELSYFITLEDKEKRLADMIQTAKSKNKLCVYYNIVEDSRRAIYEFIKI